jgi:thiol-disulfide isomerase/thioredoxin
VATVLLAAVALAGCSGSSAGNPSSRLSLDQAKQPIKGAPPQLAAIRTQANQLLPGGKDAFDARLAQLKGYPVVVNKWASWCGPCRFEFQAFQKVSAEYGKRVAFLGVNSEDSDDAAKTFLGEAPVPYPSYTDPSKDIFDAVGATLGLPVTAFYNRKGEQVYLDLKPYYHTAELRADVERYALGEGG